MNQIIIIAGIFLIGDKLGWQVGLGTALVLMGFSRELGEELFTLYKGLKK